MKSWTCAWDPISGGSSSHSYISGGRSQLICLPRSKKLAHFEFPGSKPGFCLLPNLHQKMIAGKEKQVSVLKQLSLDLVLLLLLLRPLFK
jgi:hypothetical protein